MFRQSKIDDAGNRFIRDKIRQARLDANESQEDLAEALGKSRVTISDLERGRVEINASDLGFIAAHYDKPISYFYPPRVVINKDELSALDEELLFLFFQLPETQKRISIEYVRQQVEITNKALEKTSFENLTNIKKEEKIN